MDGSSQNRKTPILINEDNIAAFLGEIDALICDCDGVIWYPSREIPHAKEAVDCLQDAGKKVCYVTNNSLRSPLARFKALGYNASTEDVAYPPTAVAQHLKSIGLTKKVYVIGMEHFKDQIRNEGITVVPEKREGTLMKEELSAFYEALQEDKDSDIGAVIVDIDFNLCFKELAKAANFLRDPECLFFVGASDSKVLLERGIIFLGPVYFVSMLEDSTGRKAEVIGKPGRLMIDGYLSRFHNFNVKRTVFVGDTLEQDMGLANACGMKKLLVLTGMTTMEHLNTCDPELIPDYYINSFADFYNLLKQK